MPLGQVASCVCDQGYVAAGLTCTDLNECATNNGGCDALTTCTNTQGGRACGACPMGFAGTGLTGCTDLNECATNNGGCDPLTTCTNVPGGRTCGACPAGYTGTGATGCADVNDCTTNNGGCDPLTMCSNTAGGRTCGACPAGYTGTGATGCADVNECATNNGGCDALTVCTNVPGGRTCGACPRGYSGSGTTACVPNQCNGAPGIDCACIRVTPDGSDAAALASSGATAFRNVQPAIDFANTHRDLATKVCVAAGAACLPYPGFSYPGPGGAELSMRNGISVYGGYESTGWTRCSRTVLEPATATGVYFGPDVQSTTVLDGFAVACHPSVTTTGITVQGARGVELTSIQVTGPPNAVNWRGLDVSGGAEVTTTVLSVFEASELVGSTGEATGVRSVGSRIALLDSTIGMVADAGDAHMVWLENSAGSRIVNPNFSLNADTFQSVVDVLAGVRIIGGGDIEITGGEIDVGMSGEGGVDTRGVDISGNGTGTVTINASAIRVGQTRGEGVALRSVSARVLFQGTLLAQADSGAGLALTLEDAPGSDIRGSITASGESALGVGFVGDAAGVVIHASSISARAFGEAARGVSFSSCAGAAPVIQGNPSITATAESGSARAITATGQCHARIESNGTIAAIGTIGGGSSELTLDGIRCSAASRCVITGNTDIRTDGMMSSPGPRIMTAAIGCDSGSCERIAENTILGMSDERGGCRAPCVYEGYGIDLSFTNTAIDRNQVSGACGDFSAGIRVTESSSRIQNNRIFGRPLECEDSRDNSPTSFGILHVSGQLDVHSNTIDGGGNIAANNGCTSAAVSPSGGVFRNNILRAGRCSSRHGMYEEVPFFSPPRLENNNFVPTGESSGLYFENHNHHDIVAINAFPGASGNFSADPRFVSFPDDLHLLPDSPCIDLGTPTGAPISDMDGQARSSTLPDVGADEWGDYGQPCLGVTCSGHGICERVGFDARCVCDAGFVSPPGSPTTCADINECATNNGGCDPLTTCTNTPGGRTCGACPSGHSGNGETGCTAIAFCATNPCEHGAACIELPSGYACDCPPGVTGSRCEQVFGQIASGGAHRCGVHTDGTLACWGSNDFGQSTPPSGAFQAVAAGMWNTCVLRTDGTISCWGFFGNPQPIPTGAFTAISGGSDHTCAIRTDGTLACWGGNFFGQAIPPAGTFQAVSGSVASATPCAIRTDGTLACWGRNSNGQATPPSGTFLEVSVGSNHGCAIRTDGTLACWGHGAVGQLAAPAGTFSTLAAGSNSTCAIRTDGTVACWGENALGVTNAPAGTFQALSSGSLSVCGIRTDDTVECWGYEGNAESIPPGRAFRQVDAAHGTCGIRADGTAQCWLFPGVPALLPGLFTELAVGTRHVCGLHTNQNIECWGSDSSGQLLAPGGAFSAVAAGTSHSCALGAGGSITCWGSNAAGQITPPSGAFTAVDADGNHSCGIRSGGTLACWGSNGSGESTPPSGTFSAVAVGETHACGLRQDGTLACWGSDANGQSTPPVGTFTAISGALNQTCAIRANGTVVCWGGYFAGDPVLPALPGAFTSVAAGVNHSCGIRADLKLSCWGMEAR